MSIEQLTLGRKKALALKAFDMLFNKRD